MNYYASRGERDNLISGLRDLADFLESDQDVPVPCETHLLVFPHHGNHAEDIREIDAIARRIGAGTELSWPRGHYRTSRWFGPVEYRAVAIPPGPGQGGGDR